MSAAVIVNMVAVRKSDHVPYASFYLGGDGTRNALFTGLPLSEIDCVNSQSGRYCPITIQQAADILLDFAGEFYAGHDTRDALNFLCARGNDFALFIEVT